MRYNKRIEIWSFGVPTDNGFGGQTATDSKVGDSWCTIKTYEAGKYRDLESYGVIDPSQSLLITLRKRNDIDFEPSKYYIKYEGTSYTIVSKPINKDFKHKEVAFLVSES